MRVIKVRQPHLYYNICYRCLFKDLYTLHATKILSLLNLRVKSAHWGAVPLLLHLPHGQ